MASKTVYTSMITVPVYAAWKCEKCGQANFSDGKIRYQVETSSGSMLQSKHDEAKAAAQQNAQSGWADHALSIMLDPNQNAQKMRNDLFLNSTKCTQCGAKPKWNKDMLLEKLLVSFAPLILLGVILSGIIAFANKESISAWLFFILFAGLIIYSIADEALYKRRMKNLPKEYTPVIGSLNQELIERAAKRHRQIPSPEQAFEIIKKY